MANIIKRTEPQGYAVDYIHCTRLKHAPVPSVGQAPPFPINSIVAWALNMVPVIGVLPVRATLSLNMKGVYFI